MKRWMLFIPFIIFFLLGVLLWRGLYLDPKDIPSALIDKPFPEFELPILLSDENKTKADILGQPLLINVWGTWCVSCKVEHPFLVDLSQQGIAIMGINYKDDNDAARRWLKDLGDPYIFSVDDEDGTLSMDLGVTGAPETFFVDAKGIVRYRHQGPITASNWDKIKPHYDALNEEQ
ncbi:DsbE family thiol:disulfide interchange protein [Bermanella marisrubri]|uniref:Thiol:disulfide interchange protein DsbE n=1 Tax=Bermanella marisrubri TaxID=207949 RepID=Q1N1Q0_9GAMM|nr:DsbE family thiol:disulfide interchange protein [Bermanella marisrubri]EAT12231.1 thiol:disulfide interchange protein DsbE [Oceanobacter sp. RED65] [Bermanella marisrubri]QIZ83699.1 DsbE family thiol:disulfide interchange protein [Bermanella marisrubri]